MPRITEKNSNNDNNNDSECGTHQHHEHLVEPDSGIAFLRDETSSGSISDNTSPDPTSPNKKRSNFINPMTVEKDLEKESDLVKMLFEKV